MANKIKCTCGHSWSTADSSAKDKYVCHICGKDNTMKDGGWLSKYDVPEAQNGIEGTMGGLTDKGFNYNGAWGGTMQDGGNLMPAMAGANQTVPMAQLGDSVKPITMQLAMGGSLPGAVGFTYARTAGAAPANGPYAKKTKASAKDGEEVKYKDLPEVKVQGINKKRKAVSDETRVNPIVTDKPMNRETVKSTNKSYRMSPQEALLNKLKGKKLKESQDRLDKTAEKITAVGSLSPNPFISVPSGITNFALGVTGAPTTGDAGLDYMGLFGSAATPEYAKNLKKVAKRVPFFKGLSLIDAASDIFEFTPSEDLPKKQNGGEMKFYQEGLDWKPRNISRDGSVIKDDRGQWAHPGEITEIGSPYITMEGVPYPVLGISDTGDVQMMYPGEDYEFDGETVTEYPVAQSGITLPTQYTDNPNDPRLKAYNDSLMFSSKLRQNPNPMISVSEWEKLHYSGAAKNYAEKGIMPIGFRDFSEKPYRVSEPVFAKPKQKVEYRKPEPKKPEPVKETKKEQPKPVERKQNVYEGSPVYSSTSGSGGPSALIGFSNQKGDTTFIKPEDYERFGVPKYGKEFIQSRKKQRNGGVNNADAQPIKKLDQSLNFTNYNKPTKGGWLDKYK